MILGRVRYSLRTTIRVAALTVVLTLAGTPAATAACLVWCSSPCPGAMQKDGATISASLMSCDDDLVGAPSLREESRRERQASSIAYTAAPSLKALFKSEGRSVTLLALREHAPPGHSKAPTVLRL